MSEAVQAKPGQRLAIRDVEGTDAAVLTLLDSQLNYTSATEVKLLLKQAVSALAEDDGKHRFVLNLGNVGVLDSSGLAVLISLKKKVDGEGGELSICHLSTMICRLFELTGLSRAFEIVETEEEALKTN
ncbi:MAG: STAS domain-containing protein [Planctomycetota bacterium]